MAKYRKKKEPKTLLEIYNELQEEADYIIKIFKSDNYNGKHYGVIAALNDCRHSFDIDWKESRLIQGDFNCGKRFCPLCSYCKTRVEIAKLHYIYTKIESDPALSNVQTRYLTLKLNPHAIDEIRDKITFINTAYGRFMKYKHPKNETQKNATDKFRRQGKSFNDLLVGAYKFIHVGFNNWHNTATVHLHLILLLKSSFKGNDRITDPMILERWKKATGSEYIYTHMKKLTNTRADFVNTIAYGLKTLKFKSIKKYPEQFIPITEQLHGKHSVSFSKLISESRAESDVIHKESMKSKS